MSDKYKDIDYSLQNLGPHYVDPKYLKQGFHYGLVGNLPGQIEYYTRLGYEVVKDDDVKIGQEKPNASHSIGAAVTVQSKCGQLMVLMRLPNELKEKLDQHINSLVEAKSISMSSVQGIPQENQYGKVTITKN